VAIYSEKNRCMKKVARSGVLGQDFEAEAQEPGEVCMLLQLLQNHVPYSSSY
jgi:hypothetical protein